MTTSHETPVRVTTDAENAAAVRSQRQAYDARRAELASTHVAVRFEGAPSAVEVRRNRVVAAAGAVVGATIASGLIVGLPPALKGVERVVEGDKVLEAYSKPGVLSDLAKREALDPRNKLVIDQALESTGSGEKFEPFTVVLSNGEVVEVGIVQRGDTATSIAKEIAPNVTDPSDITRIIVGQASLEGDSTLLQPGTGYVVPKQYLGE
ncbi:MAG: hypothetical protein WAS36_00375 [Candidatus Saccharimonadales bacterium]